MSGGNEHMDRQDNGAGKGRRQRPEAGPPRMWLSDLSIKQPVFIAMLTLAVLVVGGLFYSRMGLDLFPDVSLPVAVVQTVYPGASPEEVERSVTKPIEDAVISINGVESVRSTSTDSLSLVIVEFNMDKDGKEAAEDVRNRVGRIRNTLPADVQEPVIDRFDPSITPILSVALADTSGKLSPAELRSLADDTFKPRLERVPGVAAVGATGGQVSQVQINLKLAQMESKGVAPQQVIQALRAENLDVPAGRVDSGASEELLRTAGQVTSLQQLGEIPVASRPGGAPVKLRDIADITQGFEEVRQLSRLDGNESVVIDVRKQSGTNTVQVADAVKAELAKLGQEYPDISFAIPTDQSTFTREAVQDMQFTLLLGALLAALVVLIFFRDLRNTLVTIAGLPVILAATAAALYVLGMSLNMITMMALSLSIGMLIDDAIVVRENIFRHMEEGLEPREAASRGTAEIALAVVAVTSTIVAVFLPIAFTEGLAGKFLRDFGLTVAISVLVSLVEAFTLAPMLSAYFFKQSARRPDEPRRKTIFSRFFAGFNSGYRGLLSWSLRHRAVVVLVALLALAASAALVPRMGLSFLPDSDRGEFGVALELAPGSRLEETDRATRAAEGVLQADPAVEHVFTTVGATDGTVEKATFSVQLYQRGQTEAVIERLRPELAQALGDTKFSVDQQSTTAVLGSSLAAGALEGRPIQFAVLGDDFAALDRVSAALVVRLGEIPGAVDIDRSIKASRPERAIVVDQAKAASLGVTKAQVGTTVRALVNGEQAGTYRAGDQDTDIVVRLAEADRSSPAAILRLPIVTPLGAQVPLSSLASIVQSSAPSQIERENRQRRVVVGAGYLGRDMGEVLADARAAVAAMDLPAGVSVGVSGQAKYQDEMFSSLGLALGLSVLFVYMILASQFGSFVHPFTIMLALPFSVVGALLALYARGFSFDMLGMIGIILLMGLVTKNSILLVEFTNQLKRRGLSTREAILEAGPIRLRPILMTTLAMIFGMIPVAAGVGAGAELRQPMGVSVIGGLVVSTLLTL
ncbi:MAG: efflux RND transporter permease subunit, partial [Chloroflexota bacterium]